MNRVTKTLLNVTRVEVLLGIGLVMWVLSFDAKAQSTKCPITPDKAEVLAVQAADLNAHDYEQALQKCIAGKPLNNVERMLANTAEEFLKSMSPEALELAQKLRNENKQRREQAERARQEQAERERQQKNQARREQEAESQRQEEERAARIKENSELVEKARATIKLNNDFLVIAEGKMRLHKASSAFETSAVRATAAELRLLNELMLITIEQNDKMLKYMEEQKQNQ